MNGNKWTPEEKRLLKSNMSAEEIAKETGRSEYAVKRARYTYTGHSVEEGKQLTTYEERLFEAERNYHRIMREKNLINHCRQLGVRIGGMTRQA